MATQNAQVQYKKESGTRRVAADARRKRPEVESTSDIFNRKTYDERNPLAESIDHKQASAPSQETRGSRTK